MERPFTHRPIDLDRPAFRLFRLHKGAVGRPVSGELFDAYLGPRDSVIPFDALSYTWGHEPYPADEVTINERSLRVTANLHEALSYLRYEERDRYLWIDAICIDQGNPRERGHQVHLMGEIYTAAETVVCWLGPAGIKASDTILLMESLQLLQEKSVDYKLADSPYEELWASLQPALAESHTRLLERQRLGLRDLLARDWFTRVWILQEVAKARSAQIQCGASSVSTRVFSIAPLLLGVEPEAHCQAVLDIMPGSPRRGSWRSERRDLYSLMRRFRGSKASEPRDMIYALVGLSSDKREASLPADYTKAVDEVIFDAIELIYFIDFRGQLAFRDMEDFLQRLEPTNDRALRLLAKSSHGTEIFERLVKRRDDADMVQAAIGATSESGSIDSATVDIIFDPASAQLTVTEEIVNGLRTKKANAKIDRLVLWQPPASWSEELVRFAVANKRGKDIIGTLIEHELAGPLESGEEVGVATGQEVAGGDLVAQQQPWAEALGNMIRTAEYVHARGRRFGVDIMRHPFGINHHLVDQLDERWFPQDPSIEAATKIHDDKTKCDGSVPNLIPFKHSPERQLWDPTIHRMASVSPSSRLQHLWSPIIEKVVLLAIDEKSRHGFAHLLGQQIQWNSAIRILITRHDHATKQETCLNLLAQQKLLWARMMGEADKAEERTRETLLELLYQQQRLWPLILGELDRGARGAKMAFYEDELKDPVSAAELDEPLWTSIRRRMKSAKRHCLARLYGKRSESTRQH